MAWSSLEELATCTAVDSQVAAPGFEGSAQVAATIPAVMAPAAVEEAVARTAVAAQSAVDAAVAPDAADAVVDAEGSASGESPDAAVDHMVEVAADSDEVHDADTCAPVGTRRSGLDPHCRQSVLVVPFIIPPGAIIWLSPEVRVEPITIER